MYWNIAGMAVCLIGARYLKCKVSESKKAYKASLILAAAFLLAAASAWTEQTEGEEKKIVRSEPGEGIQEKEFQIDAQGEFENYPLKLEIEERKLTKTQRKECLEFAKQELDIAILGDNTSKDQVTGSLYLPQYLQEGAVEAVYSFSDYDIFSADGTMEQEPEQPVLLEITAELCCQGETCLYQFSIQAVPREKSAAEKLVQQLKMLITEQNQLEDVDYIELPQQVNGKKIVWKEPTINRSLIIVLMGAVLSVGIFVREKEEKKRSKTEREKQMMLDYPEIVSKLSLLLGAGMNISLAWEKIALTYHRKQQEGEIKLHYAYEEMLTVLYEIRDGVGELQAYENFGRRCQLSAYRKLSSLIVQNVRKGAKGMQKLLEEEEWEAYEQRKAQARQSGEEASTKLLLPMGIMLVIVLAIMIIPAGISLNL